MATITAICLSGTRPMNMSSMQVANSSSAVEALLRMMRPQMMPTHSITGSRVG